MAKSALLTCITNKFAISSRAIRKYPDKSNTDGDVSRVAYKDIIIIERYINTFSTGETNGVSVKILGSSVIYAPSDLMMQSVRA